jgi:hypothetical protein
LALQTESYIILILNILPKCLTVAPARVVMYTCAPAPHVLQNSIRAFIAVTKSFLLMVLLPFAFAHKEPNTAKELQVQQNLQAAASYVHILSFLQCHASSKHNTLLRQSLATFTAAKQRSLGCLAIPGYGRLFAE